MGRLLSELIECSISSEKNTYVKETNESSFSVRIRGKNEEECKELAEIVQSGLDAYTQKLAENFPAQRLAASFTESECDRRSGTCTITG